MTDLDRQAIAEKASATLHDRDACATLLGITIDDVQPGSAVVSMVVESTMANGHGICQGGLITTLADTAFAHASNSYNRTTVAQGISIDFVKPALLGQRLSATASEQHRGKTTGIYEVRVRNEDDQLLAIFTGRSFELNQPVFDHPEDDQQNGVSQ